MAKNNSKSVRLSNEVLSIVESYRGEGFNQKLENLVLDFKKTIPEREAMKEHLEVQIAKNRKELQRLKNLINQAERLNSGLKQFLNLLDSVNEK